MRFNMLLVMFFPFALAIADAVHAGDDADLRSVICAETQFSRAAEARNLQAFLARIDPDARFANSSVAHGKVEIAKAWAVFFDPDGPVIRWRPSITEISEDGQLALSRGPYRVTAIEDDGSTRESWGHFISTWRKNENGEWLVLFDSGGDDGMTPSDAEIAILLAEPECP
jgi:ketosteroid isomerase-like protein